MVTLQTTEAAVPGSNPASLTVENSEDRQSHCVYCKNLGAERKTSPWNQKKKDKKGKANVNFYRLYRVDTGRVRGRGASLFFPGFFFTVLKAN